MIPPPDEWHASLRHRAAALVAEWHASHGHLDGYRHLPLARRYLVRQEGGGGGGGGGGGHGHGRGQGGSGGRGGNSGNGGDGASSSSSGDAAATAREHARAQRWLERFAELRGCAYVEMAEMRRGADALEGCLRMLAPSFAEAASATAAAARETAPPPHAGQRGGLRGQSWRRGRGRRRLDRLLRVHDAATSGSMGGDGDEGGGGDNNDDGGGGGGDDDSDEGGSEGDDDGAGAETAAALYGAMGGTMTLSLDEPEQQRAEDRGPLVDALRDAYAEAARSFEPKLRGWLLTLSKVAPPAGTDEASARTALLERVTALRARLRTAMDRAHGMLGNVGGESGAKSQEAAVAAAAAGGGGGDDGGDDGDDDGFEDVDASLKPGYEARWVDPDAGWEKPPPEAMRAAAALPAARPPASRQPGGVVAVEPEAAVAADDEPALGEEAEAAEGARCCAAPRRDGTLCRRWIVGDEGACAYHGPWVERDPATGVPLHPAAGSVWARLIARRRHETDEAPAVVASTGAPIEDDRPAEGARRAPHARDDQQPPPRPREGMAEGGGGEEEAARWHRGTTGGTGGTAPAQTPRGTAADGSGARKRARGIGGGGGPGGGVGGAPASSSLESTTVVADEADGASKKTRREPTGRQRLAKVLERGAGKALASSNDHIARAHERQHSSRQGW